MAKKQQKKSQKGLWVVGGVAVAATALLVALSLMSAKPDETNTGTDVALGGMRNVKGGDETAKVHLVEYGDFL